MRRSVVPLAVLTMLVGLTPAAVAQTGDGTSPAIRPWSVRSAR